MAHACPGGFDAPRPRPRAASADYAAAAGLRCAAGLIGSGAHGGSWMTRPPPSIRTRRRTTGRGPGNTPAATWVEPARHRMLREATLALLKFVRIAWDVRSAAKAG